MFSRFIKQLLPGKHQREQRSRPGRAPIIAEGKALRVIIHERKPKRDECILIDLESSMCDQIGITFQLVS